MAEMTYPQFLLLFLCPPLVLMLIATRGVWSRPAWLALVSLMAIAFTYTAPWDNYLVIRGVWSFDDDRIWGVFLWRVPLEEYLFYLLQVLITGLFTLWLLARARTRAE
jgi:lycopene beta-cyclase